MAGKFTSGGQVRKPATAGRKPENGGTAGKLFLAIVTFLNLLLSVLAAILRRQEIIHAVQGSEDVQVLLTAKEKTIEK